MSKRTDDESSRGLSRRGFLKGGVVTAAGAAIADTALAQIAESRQGPRVYPPAPTQVTLNINGKDRTLEIEPRTTLADALRDRADMTGTKVVCDRGACSACTVFVNDLPVLSCMTLAIEAQRKKIRTIEGLAEGDKLHPVQEQFIQHDALQCGFCTPGMVMSCASLLARNRNPSLEEVKQATSGNLCRCGTYTKVCDATLAAAKMMNGQNT